MRSTSRFVKKTRKRHVCEFCGGVIEIGSSSEVQIQFIDAVHNEDYDYDQTVVSSYYHTNQGCKNYEGM